MVLGLGMYIYISPLFPTPSPLFSKLRPEKGTDKRNDKHYGTCNRNEEHYGTYNRNEKNYGTTVMTNITAVKCEYKAVRESEAGSEVESLL